MIQCLKPEGKNLCLEEHTDSNCDSDVFAHHHYSLSPIFLEVTKTIFKEIMHFHSVSMPILRGAWKHLFCGNILFCRTIYSVSFARDKEYRREFLKMQIVKVQVPYKKGTMVIYGTFKYYGKTMALYQKLWNFFLVFFNSKLALIIVLSEYFPLCLSCFWEVNLLTTL